MRNALFLLAIALLTIGTFAQDTTQGTLYAVNKKGTELGACPLNNTAVRADISGFLARVSVKQEFVNSYSEPIEAVYTFPLSQNGAVDDMTMTVGTRVVRGKIMKREEARQVYEDAKAAGQAASLLDQERPNIFTQAVANIMPGEKVIIEISYVETLKYEDGAYEFIFPMTVGPRYIPGSGSVTDANKIKPPVVDAERAGHDISVEVNLNASVPVEAVRSSSHQIAQSSLSPSRSKITLQSEKVIPNKDFILRYDVTGKRLEDGVLTHRDKRGGFFTLVLQPPDTVAPEDRTPKEIVFVLDTSGSMSGFPIEKAKEAMKLSLDGLYPEDTFNLITFAGDTRVLFEEPVPATQANLERAQAFLDSRQGGGGTEMMKAIKAALDPSDSQEHLRIVCFMTDAFVGNDNEIIAEIQKHPKARVFSFGIGSSVNRALLDKMAEAGNGEVEIVTLDEDGSKAAKRFYERVRTPMLTDLSIDWNGMPVADVYPSKIGDLFSAKPVIVNARYTKGATGTIKLKGKVAGQPYERSIKIELPETESANDVLATLWARRRVDELSMDALKPGANAVAVSKQIEGLGLEFRILTSFTSFVAVEEKVVNRNGTPTRIDVPVAIPEGVDRQMATGEVQETVAVHGGGGGGSVATRQIANLPLNTRQPNALVLVAGASATVDVSSSKIKTKARKSSGKGSGRASGSGSGSSGSGSGSGVGYGSGSGSGDGSGNGPANGDTPFRRMEILSSLQRPPQVISAGVLNGKATSLPKPEYPAAARAVGADGTVSIYVVIDESGTVVSAEPVSGHPLLRAAAVKAAKEAKFTPTMLSGKPVQTMGLMTYRFMDPDRSAAVDSSAGTLAIQDANSKPPTAEMIRQWQLKEKAHSWVYAVIERLEKGDSAASANENSFVRNGKASVRVVLKDALPETLERIKAAGFESGPAAKGARLAGTIAVDKLAGLAELDQVVMILPAT